MYFERLKFEFFNPPALPRWGREIIVIRSLFFQNVQYLVG
jgi:hypothetical protein